MKVILRCAFCGKEYGENTTTADDDLTFINLYICSECMKKLLQYNFRVMVDC